MKPSTCIKAATALLAVLLLGAPILHGQVVLNLEIKGTDSIFLAGRDDVLDTDLSTLDYDFRVVSTTTNPLLRHNYTSWDSFNFFSGETRPQEVSVTAGDVVKLADPAIGGVDFYNNTNNLYGPEGNIGPVSDLYDQYNKFDGISMYKGPEGSLTGIFLTAANPLTYAVTEPSALDYSITANRNMASFTPAIGEIFFIGDGQTDGGTLQEFTAPAGATRLFLGIPDGFGFDYHPGAYEDNDGSYRVILGINTDPVIPEPQTIGLLASLGLFSLIYIRSKIRNSKATR